MPRFLILAAALMPFVPIAGWSHDLKILTNRPRLDVDGKATIYLSWGHRLPIDDLIDGATLARYDLIAPSGTKTPLTKDAKSLQANVAEMKEPGLYAVIVERMPSVNTYIIDEQGIKRFRRGPKSAHAGSKIDSAKRSTQSAKLMIVVGDASATAPKAIGLSTEIIPLDGPSRWKAGQPLRVRVDHDGKPLAGARIESRAVSFAHEEKIDVVETDARGEATVQPKTGGLWLLTATHKTPAPAAARAEYDTESITTTLTLEVAP